MKKDKTDQTIEKYAGAYRKVLKSGGLPDTEEEIDAYRKRLKEMYASDNFRKYNVYPTTNTVYVFAIIAMCLQLKQYDLGNAQIIDMINTGFAARRNFFKILLRGIDLLPNAYAVAEKFNISDHAGRVKDGSVTYDYFRLDDGKIEYSISRCAYVEMFETYGIRSLCKIFCMTDTTSYNHLSRHVKFIRYSDLSDGSCCHDVVLNRRKIRE